MALCYNFTRVLNIIGFNTFIAYLAKRAAENSSLLFQSAAAALRLVKTLLAAICGEIMRKSAIAPFRFTPAG